MNGMAAIVGYARVGDTVVVTAIDRLGARSPRSPAPLPNSASDESYCAPYEKELTPLPPLLEPWRRSWPRWPNSNSVENAALHPENPAVARQMPATKPPKPQPRAPTEPSRVSCIVL